MIDVFSEKIIKLRKLKGWSQPDLGKIIGTSGQIVGRYERGKMIPSIQVARKIAKAFDVTLDFLFTSHSKPKSLEDKDMIRRLEALDKISDSDKKHLMHVVDAFIRDCQARKAYQL
ncbi:MAG: helix-turn-helix transcriptional regulator [Waddliaceae bacterium]